SWKSGSYFFGGLTLDGESFENGKLVYFNICFICYVIVVLLCVSIEDNYYCVEQGYAFDSQICSSDVGYVGSGIISDNVPYSGEYYQLSGKAFPFEPDYRCGEFSSESICLFDQYYG
ncbi:MAG: hypothetical protein EZS28_020422, partial [Streblomastix strix]